LVSEHFYAFHCLDSPLSLRNFFRYIPLINNNREHSLEKKKKSISPLEKDSFFFFQVYTRMRVGGRISPASISSSIIAPKNRRTTNYFFQRLLFRQKNKTPALKKPKTLPLACRLKKIRSCV